MTDRSSPVQFVLLNSHSKWNVMQCKEWFNITRQTALCQEHFFKNLGQSTAFVPKCNTNKGAEKKCNAAASLSNEIICFFAYNNFCIQSMSGIILDISSNFIVRTYMSTGTKP